MLTSSGGLQRVQSRNLQFEFLVHSSPAVARHPGFFLFLMEIFRGFLEINREDMEISGTCTEIPANRTKMGCFGTISCGNRTF